MCQSRLIACTSSAQVIDQKPSSFSQVAIGLQCTGSSRRNRSKMACGNPSFHNSMSPRSIFSTGISVTLLMMFLLRCRRGGF